jgi:hypothetical protein
MGTSVIIPARNEAAHIYDVVKTFTTHPETTDVFVGIDSDTTDDTAERVMEADGVPIPYTDVHGKGEVVAITVKTMQHAGFLSPRIILCDGDYSGLTHEHIDQILAPGAGMAIGIPDWPDCDVPNHVTNSWPSVSGFRCLPWHLVPHNAHGYLLETQLNLIAVNRRLPIQNIFMFGLKSPFQWPLSPRRQMALRNDLRWGKDNGIL